MVRLVLIQSYLVSMVMVMQGNMWKLLVILAFVKCEESCEKDAKKSNEAEQCDGSNKITMKIIDKNNAIKMINIAENVLMPEIGYGTWKVVGDEPIYKVFFNN